MKNTLIAAFALVTSFYFISCESPNLTPDKCISCIHPALGDAEEVCVEGTLTNTKKRIEEAKAEWEKLGFTCSDSYNK